MAPDHTPLILAPAGDKNSFLAAIAAGADAVYCGLKTFSARMEADNFSIEELGRLSALARSKNVRVYIAFNSVIKEQEREKVVETVNRLCRSVHFDALIVQDTGMIELAGKAGFRKEFHLSTLGNCSSPSGLKFMKRAGFSKIVLPREFTIDEIKDMAANAPKGLELEIFIHGALCYSVSGRCYWSSWLGGKSSLRGRCVQPCRRMYRHGNLKKRYFSCLDFSADVIAKVLRKIPKITAWKIEGRKKGPHYVYYSVKAYKLLRDEPGRKKEALSYLGYAMGRKFTHYNLLSQRPGSPLDHSSETGSGLFAGRIRNESLPYFVTREGLFPGDLLRAGYEDSEFHDIQKVTRAVPKKGKFYLKKPSGYGIKKGSPVFIIDRREKQLYSLIEDLEAQVPETGKTRMIPFKNRSFSPGRHSREKIRQLYISRDGTGKLRGESGLWISNRAYSVKIRNRETWLWLDPLIFPDEEKKCLDFVARAVKMGSRNFVLNALWQIEMFKRPEKSNIWAGPFCNVTNTAAVSLFKKYGFSGVIVSPELDRETFLSLPENSDLPLGVLIYANWPLAVSRIISEDLKKNGVFESPKGENAWISKFNKNYFIFPNWHLDLRSKNYELKRAGYSLFADIHENIPSAVRMKNRPGLWNWNLKLL